jgi:hypothetical protein
VQTEEADGFYMRTAYRMPVTPQTPGVHMTPDKTRSLTNFPLNTIIARPAHGDRTKIGPQEIVGVAYSGESQIAKVEVSLNGGSSWKPATLEGPKGDHAWRVFRYKFDQATPQSMTAFVRARDIAGRVQPRRADWNPGGYFWNGWPHVAWEVTAT